MNRFIAIDHLGCTGCKACEVACSLYHFGECNPWKSAIRVIRNEINGLAVCLPVVCQQCEQAHCIDACPVGALSRDKGIMTIEKEACEACGLCSEACPAGCIPVGADGKVIVCCDLCDGQPQCVLVCHAQCLTEVEGSMANEKQNVEHLAKIIDQEGMRNSMHGRSV